MLHVCSKKRFGLLVVALQNMLHGIFSILIKLVMFGILLMEVTLID